ncbi:thioredoxin [Propionicimonas sp.]|uniref:thioredoxin n=1 Tax=Propionicimonas sp. TaxID=1955623 RepID=UPI0017DEC83C|nr:thioredoxin [Propionicimonas sp.]MBU3976091.1 thioredoxin [Actinomycetota bacterium]MBA3020904.1 thioredoxin [Propionicimonas sp.]MBU3985281.1 thioredoxin [Actinomycetota bacterium]MBU4008271.1 thioredoxin [Actinomycetota bacterium]MBU4064515.1 thioredoxin [Actinomycetota bacterium]
MSSIATCPSCGTKNRVPVASAGRPQCASCHQPLPWLVNASDADLDAALNTSQLVLIDLWAPWCAPCRMVAPVLERLSVRYAGRIKVVKINVDNNRGASARFDAQSIPTLVMMRNGKTVERIVGAQTEPVLAKRIDGLLA